jgi:hypothetical protein
MTSSPPEGGGILMSFGGYIALKGEVSDIFVNFLEKS